VPVMQWTVQNWPNRIRGAEQEAPLYGLLVQQWELRKGFLSHSAENISSALSKERDT